MPFVLPKMPVPQTDSALPNWLSQYWFVRGLYAEKDGHKMDALVDYRNSLALYPPRRPRPDGRDEVMASAERLWKDLGGTTQGWNDWATQSSLAGFYGNLFRYVPHAGLRANGATL